MDIETWFAALWEDYRALAPRVSSIRDLLVERGESVENDHVAFRTLDIGPLRLEKLEPIVLSLGYEPFDDYQFPAKKLLARSYVHPQGWPRVFLSELLTGELAPPHQRRLQELADQVDPAQVTSPAVFMAGPLWRPVAYEDYLQLRETSEYAAWVAALGLRPNHFTVFVNALRTFDGLEELLDFVVDSGFELNESGGRIKGSRDVLLEQGSTLADELETEFAGGRVERIPTCYYEFAQRHPTQNGDLYQGFVAASADRIFESTDSKQQA